MAQKSMKPEYCPYCGSEDVFTAAALGEDSGYMRLECRNQQECGAEMVIDKTHPM